MKRGEGSWIEFELIDIIRINQLVRHQIDFDGFQRWYESLSIPEQVALIAKLCEFAHQAGFDQAIYEEALAEAGLQANDPLMQSPHAASPHWLRELPATDRFTVFKKFVYLFGHAEGRVYRRETKESCNHWWHRDLLDERVVRAILDDPQFYRTSMKDDDLIR